MNISVTRSARANQVAAFSLGCIALACSGAAVEDPTEASAAVAAVVVSPSNATVEVGATIQLTASPQDEQGNPLTGRTVSWSSAAPSVASVDQTGLVTALVVGAAEINAMSEGEIGIATITATGSPPPPGPADTLFSDDFESGNLNAWDDIFSTQAGNYQVIDDANLAYSGTKLLRVAYPGTGGGAGAASKFVQPGERFYSRIRLRFPANWQGETKLMMIRGSPTPWGSFGVGGTCPDGTDFVNANAIVTGGDPGPLRLYSYFVDMAHQPNNPSVCWGNTGVPGEDPSPGPTPLATYYDTNFRLARDQWHTLELEVQLNTIGQSDGWQRLWADGTLVAEWTNMRLRTDAAVVLQAFTLENSSHSQIVQELYVDDVLVTTARP